MSAAGPDPRRLHVLRGVVLAAALCLVLRVAWLQIVRHEELAEIAEIQWWSLGSLPAERGDIFDRAGRPLALSVLEWNVGVAPTLAQRPDTLAARLGRVLDRDPATIRRTVAKAGDRHVVLERGVVLDREQKARLRRERAVTMDTVRARIYPVDGVGASLVGFCRHERDTTYATGLEHALQDVLAGRPGRFRSVDTGIPGRDLGRIVVDEPVHGRSVVLTVDADLQAIAERRLAEAVAEHGAAGGSVLILEPATGDVLAAASSPVMPTRETRHRDAAVWNNRNFTWLYEPGSVFKIFTTASLLRRAAVDTATVFDCSDPQLDGFTIRNDDDHRYGDLPLMRAFTKSANIWFARAVANLGRDEFHRDLLDFGFGQPTLAPYGGQPAGILREPAAWSRRSQATLAIGQEIAVTPLQLGMAVAAVANGGTLYAPRLVREVLDHEGRLLQERPPLPLRRVVAEPLAAVLREAMGRVVREGTAAATRLDWITVGGKTGTAQKSRDGRGMTAGAYVATFAGFAPLEDPRLVVVVILDEPKGYRRYYAAQSAVPLFRRVLEDVRCSTSWLTDVPGPRTRVIATAPAGELVTVPDVLQLSVDAAAQRLAAAGLTVAGAERGGLVAEQVPAAGSRCRRGTTVRLAAAARPDAAADAAVCPDFTGRSNREVRSLAARLGLDVIIEGAGYAVRQEPPAGQVLSARRVKVRMEAAWR
ncbi:MAG: penicillin-binding transpeptidase domain-containing protein [Candidatus Krumholzibacteriia bacterium]